MKALRDRVKQGSKLIPHVDDCRDPPRIALRSDPAHVARPLCRRPVQLNMEAGLPEAPPLVLLHGIGSNSMGWRFQYAGLADRYRVIGWNAPGYMLSDNLLAETPGHSDYAGALK